ncbi:hypothetical protein [uncultured Cohaesibacter sp.]|uniref:hypothetical protein n=1 Tax=uncultured Cohaesibacter sp. TaxID=1002546 RepID=UPI00292E5995|nr:hypothetical protein [uncultured Cohaesibacter sp.]
MLKITGLLFVIIAPIIVGMCTVVSMIIHGIDEFKPLIFGIYWVFSVSLSLLLAWMTARYVYTTILKRDTSLSL